MREVPVDPDLAKQLTAAGKAAKTKTALRDQLIGRAYAAGGGPREIGRLAGVSHVQVLNIVRRDGVVRELPTGDSEGR